MRAQVPQLEARLARAGHGDVARRPATDLAYWSEGSIAGRGALARWHGGTWWHIRCRDHVRGGLGGGRRHYYLGPRPGRKCSCSLVLVDMTDPYAAVCLQQFSKMFSSCKFLTKVFARERERYHGIMNSTSCRKSYCILDLLRERGGTPWSGKDAE